MAMLLGKKVGMTRVYDEAGRLIPVTVIEAGPCAVTQVKKTDVDGYNAVQLGFDDVKVSRQKQPQVGHTAKADTEPKRFVKECRLPAGAEPEYELGRYGYGVGFCRGRSTSTSWEPARAKATPA